MGSKHNSCALLASEIACIYNAILPAAVAMHNIGLEALTYVLKVRKVAYNLHLCAESHAIHELGNVFRHHLIILWIDVQNPHA